MADKKLEIAIQGLRDIVNPLGKFHRELKDDESINGAGIVMLMREPETYKRIARETLKKLRRKS